MTTKELEQAILTIICDCKKYTGSIEVIETFSNDKHLGYILKLGLNVNEKPFSISCEGDSNQFLKYVKEELRNSRLHEVDYFKGIQIYEENQRICNR